MAYKALYRKYRPTSFDSVIGQEAIVTILQNAIKENKISHAYLFSGPRGTGKTSIAKLFAKAINCLNPKNGLACNECEICNYIDSENSTDIIEIDAASNNGVDEIRELKNKVNLVPSKCKYKVYIIDEVHMLSIGAFNALLKTLEEPPHHAVFILATTESHKIPLTIVSRCQNLNFKKITDNKLVERLKYIIEQEKINIEEKAIEEIAQLSDGGMRDAIGLLEQLNSFANDEIKSEDVYKISGTINDEKIAAILTCTIENKIDKIFEYINDLYEDGKDFVKITEKIIIFLRNALLFKKAHKYFKNHVARTDTYEFANNIEEQKIYEVINQINNELTNMRNSSHPKILFEIMMLKLINEGKSNNIVIEEENIKKEEPIIKKIEKDTLPKEEPVKNDKMIDQHKQILINNTIAKAEKVYLQEFNEKREQLQTYLIKKEYKTIATLLLDSKVAAASQDHVLLTYKYDVMVDKADDLLSEIEDLITKIMDRKYTVVAVEENNWTDIRPRYLKLKKENKEITLLPEEEIIIKKKEHARSKAAKKNSKELSEAINIFGEDLIEMKG